MRRRPRRREEPKAHDAWAVPYGDLVTLLLAFFVVMYATSSVNEGKYRVLSYALSQAFGGAEGVPASMESSVSVAADTGSEAVAAHDAAAFEDSDTHSANFAAAELGRIAQEIEHALAPLLKEDLVAIRRHENVIDIEIRSDILFTSGSAEPSSIALDAVQKVAEVLRPLSNPVRIEGHTDDRPIHTLQFPSNWELSAARAARVVREFVHAGMAPNRFAIVGFGEYRPVSDNADADGRNANRRVVLSVFADPSKARDALPLLH